MHERCLRVQQVLPSLSPASTPRSAAHLLSDVASFAISLFAVWLAERKPTARATFGFHRIEIFGAIVSVFLIWVLTGVLCYEAVLRIITPEDVDGRTMFIVAVLGVVVNLVMMQILSQGGGNDHGHSHNPIELFKALFKKGGGDHGHSHGGGHGHAHGGGHGDAHGGGGKAPARILIWIDGKMRCGMPSVLSRAVRMATNASSLTPSRT